jgi:crotonobetainyl-CoA:carnitine CoA-transferase CaiB-like acyl-CoA transferase
MVGVQPLDGIRVLDLGTFLAGPFCATVLGEFGADVVKVERPGAGDSLRGFGTDTGCGDTLVWLSESRNKRSLTLNFADPRGLQILREMIAEVDVVIENFRPGVMERYGLDYEAMREINPRVVLLRVSAYGQTGPLSQLPGFARIAHAFSGLAYLAGEPDGRPVTPGSTSLADYITGLYGAIGVLMALRARDVSGEGQCIDLALFETIFRVLDEIAPAFQQFGFVRERMGADTVNVAPHSNYQCADGQWVSIACSNDTMFARFAEVIGRPELAGEELYGRKVRRLEALEEINRITSAWFAGQTRDEALQRCRDGEVPAGPINSIADIFDDPQYAHRETIVLHDSRIGPLAVPNVLPAMSATPGEIRWLGPALGEHTDEVLHELLGLDADRLAELRAAHVI